MTPGLSFHHPRGLRGAAIAVALGGALCAPPRATAAPEQSLTAAPGLFPADDTERARRGRALLEEAAVLLGGAAWYWRNLEFNSRDWDLTWSWGSWKRKLFSLDAVRFDQNQFVTNAVDHPRAGTVFFAIARDNGLGAGESYLFNLAATAVWEYGVEFKELVSLNDLVVNTTSGFAIGEPLHQLGALFRRSSPNMFNQAMAGLLTPIATMNEWADGGRRPPREAVNRFGVARETWHELTVNLGRGSSSFDRVPDGVETHVGASADLVSLRGYGRAGDIRTWVRPGSWSRIDAELRAGESGVTGGSLETRALVTGRYAQAMERRPDGGVRGSGSMVGLATGFEYFSWDRPGGNDFLAVMNVIGPVWELTARRGRLALRWTTEASGDFAMVKSVAFEGRLPRWPTYVYRPREDVAPKKGSLALHGYYYARGLSAGSRLALAWSGLDAGAAVRASRFDSIEGWDRFQEDLDDMESDFSLVDRRISTRLWIGARPWAEWARLGASIDWRYADGSGGAFRGERLDTRTSATASFIF